VRIASGPPAWEHTAYCTPLIISNYDRASGRYCMTLEFIMYDIFGLDDDLNTFGAAADSIWHSTAAVGITAWWLLQHQHGYAPLVTRVIVEKSYDAPGRVKSRAAQS